MTNFRERQTYYGAVEMLSGTLDVAPFEAGNGDNTVTYLRALREKYKGKMLVVMWDGASYHRDEKVQTFLQEVNQGYEPDQWPLTLLTLAPNAPEQNPMEDGWLAGKNHLRRNFTLYKTFAQAKHAFFSFLQGFRLHSTKFDWYAPNS